MKLPKLKGEGALTYLLSVPIVIAILSLIGQIFLQTAFVLDETMTYTQPATAFLLFGAADLPLFALLPTYDVSLIQSVVAAVNILLALLMIFLSSYAIRGKALFFHLTTLLYALDTLATIVFLGLAGGGLFLLRLTTVDYVLLPLLHVLFLSLLVYGSLLLLQKGKSDAELQQNR